MKVFMVSNQYVLQSIFLFSFAELEFIIEQCTRPDILAHFLSEILSILRLSAHILHTKWPGLDRQLHVPGKVVQIHKLGHSIVCPFLPLLSFILSLSLLCRIGVGYPFVLHLPLVSGKLRSAGRRVEPTQLDFSNFSQRGCGKYLTDSVFSYRTFFAYTYTS